jgi:hypothetical protein|tara:strand:- start:21 stop:623 length:603 start_codon:yes stop_codon:yes gene_type:complete
MSKSNYYKGLSELPIKRLVEKKGGLDYLSWSNAWDMLKKEHPKAQRIVYECTTWNGGNDTHTTLNYFTDGNTAYVKVGIVVNEIEHIDYLPVMDFRNKSIPLDKMTSFDVSKTIQRATAKAIAMHGLGLSLWTGEDIPSEEEPKRKLVSATLDVGDDNWEKVLKYVSANKHLGLEHIVKMLSQKYKVSDVVTKEIKKILK